MVYPKVKLKNFVLFVLDAFRYDFFFNSNVMHKTHGLLQRGDAIAFRVRVEHPTVTMPRIKVFLN